MCKRVPVFKLIFLNKLLILGGAEKSSIVRTVVAPSEFHVKCQV